MGFSAVAQVIPGCRSVYTVYFIEELEPGRQDFSSLLSVLSVVTQGVKLPALTMGVEKGGVAGIQTEQEFLVWTELWPLQRPWKGGWVFFISCFEDWVYTWPGGD